jgi:HEAT repeats/PBS lyase HEAT-like repeat
MAETAPPAQLQPAVAARFAEFARACKAAARAVALYPGSHPAIGASLSRLTDATVRLAETGPFRLEVRADSLLLNGAAAPRPDPAIGELAEVLHRHMIGALTVNAAADADSWRTLLLLLARTPEEVRGDGGIGRLWATAGGPSLDIVEIDYAEVLREKQGDAATIDQIIAAALAGPQMQIDDTAMQALLGIIGDPERFQQLMTQLEAATAEGGIDVKTAALLNLLRGVAEYVARTNPKQLDGVFKQVGQAAGHFSTDSMVTLLAQRDQPEAMAGPINVVGAVTDRMTDASVAQFVAGAVIAEGGATDRLAHAFQALVPERDRQRQLLALAETEVSASPMGQDESFTDLWGRVEGLLTSYSDETFVSNDYGRELTTARARAVDVDRVSDDPPDRVAAWLGTVSDSALRSLDHQMLQDLLAIEEDPLRWRDVAQTVISHADDLVRVGYFDPAWQLAEAVVDRAAGRPDREPHARSTLEQFGRGSIMKHVAVHLRNVNDEGYDRFKRICHAMGTAIIAPLAEALSSEQDARSRRRLRDILIGFGAQGRESVQQLMNAPNWEVRRTAAYLLREFGGIEGLKELVPLLSDSEPLVQREAVQGLVMNGSQEASTILLRALTKSTGRARQTLVSELLSLRDDRAAPFYAYLIKHMPRRQLPNVYMAAVEALGTFGGAESVDALKAALHHGEFWAPMRTRRIRAAAAAALRRIGSPSALDALRSASSGGPRGVRSAARSQLAGLD